MSHETVAPTHLAGLVQDLRLVVFDFDGVFTTNEVIVCENGLESVICNRSDGLSLRILREADIGMLILSTEKNPVVSVRARKLGIECRQGFDDKGTELSRLLAERGIDPRHVAYLGNDVNDLGCFALVGLPVAVGDAYPEVKAAARWVLRAGGGRGAVREFCHAVKYLRAWTRPAPCVSPELLAT